MNGKEALQNLYARASVHCPIDEIKIILQEHYLIEKELEVLEIIIKKRVDLDFVESCEDYADYCLAIGCVKEDLEKDEFIRVLTETEFNLIKSALEY